MSVITGLQNNWFSRIKHEQQTKLLKQTHKSHGKLQKTSLSLSLSLRSFLMLFLSLKDDKIPDEQGHTVSDCHIQKTNTKKGKIKKKKTTNVTLSQLSKM